MTVEYVRLAIPYGFGALIWLLWIVIMFRAKHKFIAVVTSVVLAGFLGFLALDEGRPTGETAIGVVKECKPRGARTARSCIVQLSPASTVIIQASDNIQPGVQVLLSKQKKGLTNEESFVLEKKLL